jgi:hypothetical protein
LTEKKNACDNPSHKEPFNYRQVFTNSNMMANDAVRIDKALALCKGSFIAAAKLLDIGSSSFRGQVYRNPSLREKWGRKKRGPGVKVGFTIEPFRDDREFGNVRCIQDLIAALPPDEKRRVLLWLQEQCPEMDGVGSISPVGGRTCNAAAPPASAAATPASRRTQDSDIVAQPQLDAVQVNWGQNGTVGGLASVELPSKHNFRPW